MRADETQFSYLIDRIKADDSVDAPADTIRFVKNIYRARTVPQVSALQRIKAILVYDLLPGTMIMGERSGIASGPRQVLFDAGEHAIDLRISRTRDMFSVRGQLLGFGFEGGEIAIGSHRVTLDQHGQFQFHDISAGTYDITARRNDLELVIESFVLE